MKHGYYKVSPWLTQGKGAVEVKQGSLNLAAAGKGWEIEGRKEEKKEEKEQT